MSPSCQDEGVTTAHQEQETSQIQDSRSRLCGILSEVPAVWEGSYEEILRFKNHGTELIRFRVVRMETAMMMMMMVTHSEEGE